MSLIARLMYAGLVWKERQRARLSSARTDSDGAGHLETGQRGETLAYWFLRRCGYTMVARNRRLRSGELDMIGWEGPVLAFVEVKTRTSDAAGPPEVAVSRAQQRRIARAAEEYMRRLKRRPAAFRFDIASVHWDDREGLRVRLIRNAFEGGT
jgi:putative endonuclease